MSTILKHHGDRIPTSHGWRRLDAALVADYGVDLAGWNLVRATAIARGGYTIGGYGTNPPGQTEAWVVQLPH